MTLQKSVLWFRQYLVAVVFQQQVEVPAPLCMYVCSVTKVPLASEYLFVMTREKYVENQHGHKIQIAMTRSLFCYKVNQVLPFCL